MNPFISLLIFLAFVVFLYVRESKTHAPTSFTLWVPLIWMLLIYSKSPSSWLNPRYSVESEFADDWTQGNAIDQNIIMLLMFIGLVILFVRKIKWAEIIKNNGWMVWLYYFCSISVLWSDIPFVSLKRLIRDLGNFIMVFIVLTEVHPIDAMKKTFRKCMYILMPLSVVLIKYFPEYGRYWSPYGGDGQNIGAAVGKNGLGQICLLGGFFFSWELINRWRRRKVHFDKIGFGIDVLFILMIGYLFLLADSQTSLATLLIGLVILLYMSLIKKSVKYADILLLHLVIFIIALLSTDLINIVLQSMGREATLTGRTDLWADLLKVDINPVIGTGFRSFWSGDRLEQIWSYYWWHPKQAHNGYLETYLNIGLIGLISLIFLLISNYLTARRELITNFDMGSFRMAVLIMILIYNWTEAAFITTCPLWFLFLFSSIKTNAPFFTNS